MLHVAAKMKPRCTRPKSSLLELTKPTEVNRMSALKLHIVKGYSNPEKQMLQKKWRSMQKNKRSSPEAMHPVSLAKAELVIFAVQAKRL